MLKNFIITPKGQFATAFGACVVLTVVAAVVSNSSAPDYAVTLRLSHDRVAGSIADLSAYKFKELIEENSGGKVTVAIYPNNGLSAGDQQKAVEMLKDGAIDIQICSATDLYKLDQRFGTFWLPFLFDNEEQAYFFAKDETVNETLQSWLTPHKLDLLTMHTTGALELSNNNRVVDSPDDLEGLKIRVAPSDFAGDVIAELGAEPVELDFSEVPHALEQGEIQGLTSNLALYLSSKLYETQPYITLWNGMYDVQVWVANEESLGKLDDKLKTAFTKSLTETVTWQHNLFTEFKKLYLKTLEQKGVTITNLDDAQRQAFREKVKPIYNKYIEALGNDTLLFFLSHRGVEVDQITPLVPIEYNIQKQAEAAAAETVEAVKDVVPVETTEPAEETAPVAEEAAPAEETAPAAEEAAPAEETAPVAEETAPAAEEAAPAETAPVAEETTPAAEEAAPAEETAPVAEETAPAAEEAAPAEETAPVAEETAPAAEEAAPAEETAPVAEETTPAAEEAAPAETAPVAEETTAPAAEEAAPAEETAPVAEETAPAAEEAAPAETAPVAQETIPAAEEATPAETAPVAQETIPATEIVPAQPAPIAEETAPAAEEAVLAEVTTEPAPAVEPAPAPVAEPAPVVEPAPVAEVPAAPVSGPELHGLVEDAPAVPGFKPVVEDYASASGFEPVVTENAALSGQGRTGLVEDIPEVSGFDPIIEDYASASGFLPVVEETPAVQGFEPVTTAPRYLHDDRVYQRHVAPARSYNEPRYYRDYRETAPQGFEDSYDYGYDYGYGYDYYAAPRGFDNDCAVPAPRHMAPRGFEPEYRAPSPRHMAPRAPAPVQYQAIPEQSTIQYIEVAPGKFQAVQVTPLQEVQIAPVPAPKPMPKPLPPKAPKAPAPAPVAPAPAPVAPAPAPVAPAPVPAVAPVAPAPVPAVAPAPVPEVHPAVVQPATAPETEAPASITQEPAAPAPVEPAPVAVPAEAPVEAAPVAEPAPAPAETAPVAVPAEAPAAPAAAPAEAAPAA